MIVNKSPLHDACYRRSDVAKIAKKTVIAQRSPQSLLTHGQQMTAHLTPQLPKRYNAYSTTQAEATKDIVDYIVGFYNCLRLHSTLGYTSPINYEQEIAAKQPSGVPEIS